MIWKFDPAYLIYSTCIVRILRGWNHAANESFGAATLKWHDRYTAENNPGITVINITNTARWVSGR